MTSLSTRNTDLERLNAELSSRNRTLTHELVLKRETVRRAREETSALERQTGALEEQRQSLSEQRGKVQRLSVLLGQREAHIRTLNGVLGRYSAHIDRLEKLVAVLEGEWRLIAPLLERHLRLHRGVGVDLRKLRLVGGDDGGERCD